jgi:hypothetical protein
MPCTATLLSARLVVSGMVRRLVVIASAMTVAISPVMTTAMSISGRVKPASRARFW